MHITCNAFSEHGFYIPNSHLNQLVPFMTMLSSKVEKLRDTKKFHQKFNIFSSDIEVKQITNKVRFCETEYSELK